MLAADIDDKCDNWLLYSHIFMHRRGEARTGGERHMLAYAIQGEACTLHKGGTAVVAK